MEIDKWDMALLCKMSSSRGPFEFAKTDNQESRMSAMLDVYTERKTEVYRHFRNGEVEYRQAYRRTVAGDSLVAAHLRQGEKDAYKKRKKSARRRG